MTAEFGPVLGGEEVLPPLADYRLTLCPPLNAATASEHDDGGRKARLTQFSWCSSQVVVVDMLRHFCALSGSGKVFNLKRLFCFFFFFFHLGIFFFSLKSQPGSKIKIKSIFYPSHWISYVANVSFRFVASLTLRERIFTFSCYSTRFNI